MKKVILTLLLISILILASACSNNTNDNINIKKYEVTIKAVDSNGDLIETAEIQVKGYDNISTNGILQLTLKAGTYTVIGKDKENNFIETEQKFNVSSNTIVPLEMYSDSKTVTIITIDENIKEKIDSTYIEIEGIQGKNNSEGYVATLKIDETYLVNIIDEYGFYKEISKTIQINKETNIIEIPLEKNPTGTVQGDLYMISSYNDPVLLNYGFVSYHDKKVTSDDDGYSIELPVGERELKITSNFGGKTKVNVNVEADKTVNKDINIPLPAENIIYEKWLNGDGSSAMVASSYYDLVRWNQDIITYSIDYTDWVIEDYKDSMFGLEYLANVVRDGVSVMDRALGDIIEYQEISDYESADVKFLICHHGDSNIGDAKGKIEDQQFNENQIISSTLYLNVSHMTTIAGDDIVAHELGHSLGISHSPDRYDLMYYNPGLDLEGWINTDRADSDRNILGLLYSMPYPTKNPFIN